MLAEHGIEPLSGPGQSPSVERLTERRIASAPPAMEASPDQGRASQDPQLEVGDRVSLLLADRKRTLLVLTDETTDASQGFLGIRTPLGQAVAAAEEGDEIELPQSSGPPLRALVESVVRRSEARGHPGAL